MSEDVYIFLTNVRPDWDRKRPEPDIEIELADEKRRKK